MTGIPAIDGLVTAEHPRQGIGVEAELVIVVAIVHPFDAGCGLPDPRHDREACGQPTTVWISPVDRSPGRPVARWTGRPVINSHRAADCRGRGADASPDRGRGVKAAVTAGGTPSGAPTCPRRRSRPARPGSAPTVADEQRPQPRQVLGERGEHLGVRDALAGLDAGVQIGDERERRVAEPELAGQARLGHAGHPDDRPAAGLELQRLGARGEPRAVDHDERAALDRPGAGRQRRARVRAGSTGRRRTRARPRPRRRSRCAGGRACGRPPGRARRASPAAARSSATPPRTPQRPAARPASATPRGWRGRARRAGRSGGRRRAVARTRRRGRPASRG